MFSALRRRERELPSRVAVLDDRMARARPGGLLEATVSASAVVSFSSTTIAGTSSDGRTRHGNTGGGSTRGDNTRDDTARGGIGGAGGFGEVLGNVTGTPDRAKHSGKRYRRRSVSLMPTAYDSRIERVGAEGGACEGEADGGSRRRPWTTSRCDEATAGERGDVTPFR